ncbi:MAG TPA: GlsB/YeaQ/YmgE family stress response membrane protein [Aliidongia sp.]|nr:GlsB/YeaQ/YmgE family stress response membrane protein [Aliidongia sp.]
MSIIGWIVLGLISGFIASKIVNKTGEGVILDIILGIVGAIVGGALFNEFGAAGITGFNLYSMIVAIVGAIIVLFIYHALFGRRAI